MSTNRRRSRGNRRSNGWATRDAVTPLRDRDGRKAPSFDRGRYTRSKSSSSEYSSSSSSDSRRASSGRSASASSKTSDGTIIHFDWEKGLCLGPERRYEIRKQLGDGTFGRVLECSDSLLRCRVAVKVIRDVKRYTENAMVEARILERVNEIRRLSRDWVGARGVVRLYDTFVHESRFFCMSFERLGKTLLQVIQMNNHCGFFQYDIQQIARELLETLDFLHAKCGLTHTDIKMENIMLCGDSFSDTRPPPHCGSDRMNYRRPRLVSDHTQGKHRSVRLIDFGNAVFKDNHHSTIVNTRQYRSPEVILEQGWDEKSDIWSIGCVIAEMWLGELLFPAHANLEHLAMIQRVTETDIGEGIMAYSSAEVKKRFLNNGRLNWPDGCESRESFKTVNECQPLRLAFSQSPRLGSLVSKLLRVEPMNRYSAKKALNHCDFFQRTLPYDQ